MSKDDRKIIIRREDLPKHRDPYFLAMVARKRGGHLNRKKQKNKKACRGKVQQ